MDALDGNAIGGTLLEYFGTEMTSVTGSCTHCGKRSRIAELRVYAQAPGAVARCPACGRVVLVAVERGARSEVRVEAFDMGG